MKEEIKYIPRCKECKSFDPVGEFEEIIIRDHHTGKFVAKGNYCLYHRKRILGSWFAPRECFFQKRGG